MYQYKDHLGNIRLSYSDSDNNGTISQSEIIEESNYYPFGLKHKGYNSVVTYTNPAQDFKYNGKELNDELGLNWYDYGARNYDPAIERWMNIDPLAEITYSYSTYAYTFNNPIYYKDYGGRTAKGMKDPYLVFNGRENRIYIYDDNDTPEDKSDDILLGSFPAHNLTVRKSKGKWEDGIYPIFDRKKRHTHTTLETKGKWRFERLLDSPNSSYGAGGIYRVINFTQSDGKVRKGMAIHAGREDKPFFTRKTNGCIRTTPECMLSIDKAIKDFGPLTYLIVKENKPIESRPEATAIDPVIAPIQPLPNNGGGTIQPLPSDGITPIIPPTPIPPPSNWKPEPRLD